MTTKRDNALRNIEEAFTRFCTKVNLQNKIGRFDINKSAERFFMPILNITEELDLQDMNIIQINYPAIDLGDSKKKVSVQITSNLTKKKFDETIDIFKKNEQLNKGFNKIIFFIISNEKEPSFRDKDIKTEIINLSNLYKKISHLDDSKIFNIDNYVRENFNSIMEKPFDESIYKIYKHLVDQITEKMKLESWQIISENLTATSINEPIVDGFYEAIKLIFITDPTILKTIPSLGESMIELAHRTKELIHHFTKSNCCNYHTPSNPAYGGYWKWEKRLSRYNAKWREELNGKHNDLAHALNLFAIEVRKHKIDPEYFMGRQFVIHGNCNSSLEEVIIIPENFAIPIVK
ncbi:MAG: hypothetical protein RIT27_1644 [Pseudomonadota bacterium]|jgi:hypothetical protein